MYRRPALLDALGNLPLGLREVDQTAHVRGTQQGATLDGPVGIIVDALDDLVGFAAVFGAFRLCAPRRRRSGRA